MRMFRKLFFYAALSMSVSGAAAQSYNDLPVIVPPSPELASLAKIGQLSAGLHTGAANVNIPLFEITAGSVRLPLSLSYSTNGIRLNDIASRVGLGWNLVAGGSITRTIHDEADGDPLVTWKAPPAGGLAAATDQQKYDYMFTANQQNFDTEYDEYSYSVNGMSGKFFIDGTGVPRMMSHSNVKMEKTGKRFILTDAQGVRYIFGDLAASPNAYEEYTNGYTTNGVGRNNKASQTGWFLQKIETPEGDFINFQYSPVNIETIQGPSQSMILSTVGANTCTAQNPCTGRWSAPVMNEVKYKTSYITGITTSGGLSITFVNAPRNDISGDVRLTDISISNAATSTVTPVKKYHFEYEDFTIANDKNQRFYLKKLYTNSTKLVGGVPDATLMHQFEYNDRSFPSQKSYAQDYYGYFNGATSNTGFAPVADAWMYGGTSEITNRTPNFDDMQKGALKKVIYPTGGYEEFNYEQHTIAEQVFDSSFSREEISGSGPSTLPTQFTTKVIEFTTGANPFVKVTVKCELNPGFTPFDPNDRDFIIFQLLQGTTNIGPQIKKNVYGQWEQNYTAVGLSPFTTYRAQIQIFYSANKGTVIVEHSPVLTPRWQNNPACGMRVNNIISFDPVSNKQTTRYYKYAKLTELNKSTGTGMLIPDLAGHYEGGGTCGAYTTGSSIVYSEILCNNLSQFSSSSISGTFSFGGSPIAYTDVIESDDPAFANGGIQHTFYTEYNTDRPHPIAGTMMPAGPRNLFADRNGIEEKTLWFKKNGSSFTTLKKSESVYSIDNRVFYSVASYVNRNKWTSTAANYAEKNLSFDCGEYKYNSTWFHLDTTTVTEYDEYGLNPMVNKTVYEYNNPLHTQPTKVTTTNSKNETLTQETKYPADYAVLPYTAMVTDHILSPVVENKSSKAGNTLAIITTDYKNWSGKIYRPEIVNMQKGSSSANKEARLHYYALSATGNTLEVAKEDGMRVSYVWDYEETKPVAEVKNASVADIAYTSFETPAGRGNWTVYGTLLPVGSSDLNNYWTLYNEAITGKQSFGGKLTKTISSSKNYTLTLWAKTGSNTPTANSLPGTLIQTKGNWKLYSWNITGVTSLSVQCNQMDEVRLYPANAFMTTYTYLPEIGPATISDAAHNIQYYEYDGLNRLLLVRDIDRNIIKQYDYQYNQAIAPCANTAADWQITGMTRCVTDANNNYTGVKERQERNENNCSSTFLQVRWVVVATPAGECVPLATCVGADKRLVNGVCETGVKTLVSSMRSGATWYCTWKYVFTDGYESPTFVTSGSGRCLDIIIDL